MKTQINPVVAVVIVVIVLLGIGFVLWKKSDTSISKSDTQKGLQFEAPGGQAGSK